MKCHSIYFHIFFRTPPALTGQVYTTYVLLVATSLNLFLSDVTKYYYSLVLERKLSATTKEWQKRKSREEKWLNVVYVETPMIMVWNLVRFILAIAQYTGFVFWKHRCKIFPSIYHPDAPVGIVRSLLISVSINIFVAELGHTSRFPFAAQFLTVDLILQTMVLTWSSSINFIRKKADQYQLHTVPILFFG